MYKIGENEMVLCPYNRSHVVSKLRIQKHIFKCKNRYPEVKLVTCFYNYTHRLRPEDVLKHYEICSQKIRMEEARYCKSQYNFCSQSIKSDKPVNEFADNGRASLLSNLKTNFLENSKKNNTQDKRLEIIASDVGTICKNEALKVFDKNDAVDDLKPLNLPKTVSKAFTVSNQQIKKSSNLVPASKLLSSNTRGYGRGKNFLITSGRPPRTNDHLLPDVSDMDNYQLKKVKSKCFFNSVRVKENSCNASAISSVFDDGITLKSDDITFDGDDDNDGFIFKNFDKYVRI